MNGLRFIVNRDTEFAAIGRNQPCPCGSGQKYKKCCSRTAADLLLPRQKVSDSSASDLTEGPQGFFQEYIAQPRPRPQLDAERRELLGRIGDLLRCEVITYAARLSATPVRVVTAITYDDLLPFTDILEGLSSDRVAVILETAGGVGEVGREMVEILHERFHHVAFVVPGTAKSTGTIMVLGGHEILMGPESSLGPIDAQLQSEGKTYSADALLEGLNRIKKEVEQTGKLNPAYIPFLQKLSPGEIEHAHNAQEFARATVRDWLAKYKFADWEAHSSTGLPVTEQEKQDRAYEISTALSSQKKWHTHGRSVRIPDLLDLRLKIRNYSEEPELHEAIRRYHVLLHMTFNTGATFKIIETRRASIAQNFQLPGAVAPAPADRLVVEVACENCTEHLRLRLDFKPGLGPEPGTLPFPKSGAIPCPKCNKVLDLKPLREQVEREVGQRAVTPSNTGVADE